MTQPLDDVIAALLAALRALDDTIEAMWKRQQAVVRLRDRPLTGPALQSATEVIDTVRRRREIQVTGSVLREH